MPQLFIIFALEFFLNFVQFLIGETNIPDNRIAQRFIEFIPKLCSHWYIPPVIIRKGLVTSDVEKAHYPRSGRLRILNKNQQNDLISLE